MAKDKILVDVSSDGSFRLNMSSDFLVQKGGVLAFNDGFYLVTKVYKFKKIRMFLVKLGFNVHFYKIKKYKEIGGNGQQRRI